MHVTVKKAYIHLDLHHEFRCSLSLRTCWCKETDIMYLENLLYCTGALACTT